MRGGHVWDDRVRGGHVWDDRRTGEATRAAQGPKWAIVAKKPYPTGGCLDE